jgi:integrase
MATYRKLPSGRWQVQIRSKNRVPLSKTFSSKSEADKWAKKTESQIDLGVFVDRSELDTITFGDLIERYLIEVTPLKKSKDVEKRRLKALKQQMGFMTLSAIQNKEIAVYRDRRLNVDGCSGSTVIKDINSISHIFNVAIKDWGYPLAVNPAQMIRKPKANKGRDRRLEVGELDLLIDALQFTWGVQSIVLLALETGMRRSEILSLKWVNIFIEDRYLILPDTKNGDSRAVPLSSKAVNILNSLEKSSDSLFFIKPDAVTRAFKRACVRVGLKDLRFHDIRHEATSRFFELGLNTMEVSAITGHKTLTMLKRYTHLKAKDLALKLG